MIHLERNLLSHKQPITYVLMRTSASSTHTGLIQYFNQIWHFDYKKIAA